MNIGGASSWMGSARCGAWLVVLALLASTACAPRRVAVTPGQPQTGCSEVELRARPRDTLHGRASYYSDRLAGRRTANGERYRPEKLSAAHRSLPFGTRLRVVRTDLPRSNVLCVRVNDRGPYVRGRVIDLSRRAAESLGMIRVGVAPVQVDVLP